MARLESEAKGGFYPTPPEEMAHILKALRARPGSNLNFLDPCAGEGIALNQMAEHFTTQGHAVKSYGIELEKSRAEKAEKVLDYVLAAGYEETRMSHEAFSMMYLNPPFAEMQGNRLEKIFLDDLSQDYLGAGGLLIFNIPQYVLKDCAGLLASRFVDIRVYRFTDENNNYNRFKQVIVFARRRKKGIRTGEERRLRDWKEKELYNLAFLGKTALSPLSDLEKDQVTYLIEEPLKDVSIFQSVRVEPEDILSSQQSSGHYNKAMQMFTSLEVSSSARIIRPALPLKVTHIAAAIASGVLPETMGDHLLVGVTKRVQDEKESFDAKSGRTQKVVTFKPKSIVRIFSENGIYNLK